MGPFLTAKLVHFESGDEGTYGRFDIRDNDNSFSCYSGELPNRSNQPNVSCIPTGSYLCKWTLSPRLKRHTYEVLNVPNRDGIRIHPANLMGDTTKGLKAEVDGCIAFGLTIGQLNGQKALLQSRDAVGQFEKFLAERDFILAISDATAS